MTQHITQRCLKHAYLGVHPLYVRKCLVNVSVTRYAMIKVVRAEKAHIDEAPDLLRKHSRLA